MRPSSWSQPHPLPPGLRLPICKIVGTSTYLPQLELSEEQMRLQTSLFFRKGFEAPEKPL